MDLFGIIGTAIVGLVVGVIAKFLMPGKDPGGFFVTMLIGIAGAFAARLVGRLFGWYSDGSAPGWIMSILGAILLLWIYRLIKNRTA